MGSISNESLDEDDKINNFRQSLSGDEIVISGISGLFPHSENVKKFMENLYDKVDMVIPVKPFCGVAEMPQYQGKATGFDKFDAQFFRVAFNQAAAMDPMTRKLMEHAYSALYDAGVNPIEFDGKRVGVFVGPQYLDTVNVYLEDTNNSAHFLSGCSRNMMSNRISYWVNGKAPSYAIDAAGAGSLACLEHAYNCIRTGICDAAIVGGSNICLEPLPSVNLKRAGQLCLDGKTKCFDRNGDGYVRSDSVNVILLQKSKDAKRIYAEVCYARAGFSLREGDEISFNRQPNELIKFFEEFYSNIDVSPSEVEYIEASAPGIAEVDLNEMEAIGRFFANKAPVKIGSVKSNMGNSEGASGMCAITKACLAYHTGKLPGNLHYKEPQNISCIQEKTVEVVQNNTPFGRGFIAINSFSHTGVDVHVLLKGHHKPKDKKRYLPGIPYLIPISGRQEDCVREAIKQLESEPLDPELIGLLQNIHQTNISNHMSRGYALLDVNANGETVTLAKSISYCPGDPRPVCFVYSGMGSQWPGMGADLLRIPVFKETIMKCHRVLEPKGVDVLKIISDTDKHIFDNILHSFIGITAVHIALTDVLKELGIVPDMMIGHSLGEMGCAYADGCFTAEETILTSYSRGLVSHETEFIPGAMAAVGLGYRDIVKFVPSEIDIACHNSSESSTISGPAEAVAKFVKELTSKGIFAKEVSSSGISYHSRYTAVAGPRLLSGLKEVIFDPKPRSPKWLCTSIPKERWNEPIAKYSSPEYHVNNLLSPVYFEETCEMIPPNAVIIEIAPHGLMQAILKRSHAECTNIPLTRRGTPNPVQFLLEAIGKIYESGSDPKVAKLYPEIEFPVSTETPLLSHFVGWEHSETWPAIEISEMKMIKSSSREINLSVHDDEYSFIKGNIRDGINVFPDSALLVLVWETLAMSMGLNYKRLPIQFKNVKFHREIVINFQDIKLKINIAKIESSFEVIYENMLVVTGFVNFYENISKETTDDVNIRDYDLDTRDIYKILYHHGYSYQDEFQSIVSASTEENKGLIKDTDNWITFIDAIIQLNILLTDSNGLLKPKLIEELSIDVFEHITCKTYNIKEVQCRNAEMKKIYGWTRCGGVKLKGITFQDIAIPQYYPDVFNNKTFFSYFPTKELHFQTALYILLQIIKENNISEKLNIIENEQTDGKPILNCIKTISKNIGLSVSIGEQEKYIKVGDRDINTDVFVLNDLFEDKQKMIGLQNRMKNNAFLLSLETNTIINEIIQNKYFITISAIRISKTSVISLMRKRPEYVTYGRISYIKINNYYKFSWLNQVYSELGSNKQVILLSVNQPCNGVTGIVKTLSKSHGNRIRLVIINDIKAPIFDKESILYKEQLEKNLVLNILWKGEWGGYYNIPYERPCTDIRHYALSIDVPGDLNSLKWTETAVDNSSRRIQVHYSGLSMNDVNLATEVNAPKNDGQFGMDYSGIDMYGNKIMGLLPRGAIANTVIADSNLMWPVPDFWTLKEAATVPLAYTHAYYCLTMRGVLHKGASVIITGGAGVLGQAVISICLAYGHNVYTTVSDNEKKKLLLKLFPGIGENRIFSSRNEYSVIPLIREFKDKRRSLIINCSSGNIRQELMSCVDTMGYFLDISRIDIKENEILGMGFIAKNRNYVAVDLSNIFKPENAVQRKELQILISDGIASGVVRPLTCVEYAPQDISKAFSFISSRRHRGKVLINFQNENITDDLSPRITCSPKSSFIISSGKNELGLEIIDLLVKRGARKIILHVKTNKISSYGEFKLKSWRKQDVCIKCIHGNIEDEQACNNIYNEAVKLGSVEGIFIVLDQNEKNTNNEMAEQDFCEKFNEVASSVINLESVSRSEMKSLRYFAIITQSSKNIFDEYVNSVAEEICRARCAVGLPALMFWAEFIDQFTKLPQNKNLRPQTTSTVCCSLEKSLRLKINNVQTFNTNHENEDSLRVLDSSTVNGTSKDLSDNDESFYENRKPPNNSVRSNNGAQNTAKPKTDFNAGLGAFFTAIDDDLHQSADPFVPLLTKLVNTFPEEAELDPSATYLMMIPGFAGSDKIFKMLSLRLKIKAFAVQLAPDDMGNSTQDIAANILTLMKKRSVLKEKFYLLGYSFGVNIALELTNLLEAEGHVGIVYCLDSSPDALRIQMDSYVGQLSERQLQNSIIDHTLKLLIGNKEAKFTKDIESLNDWQEKMDCFVNLVKNYVSFPHGYIRSVLDSAYKRIILARNYNPVFNLNSQLVLIRGIPHPDSKDLQPDYNLSKYSKHSVKVFDIESDNVFAPYDCRVPNIINKVLDPVLLEEFNNSSSCEVYFVKNNK